jgi:homoserine dehydrogenase
MRLILVGFGTVGQGLVEILHEKADDLAQNYGFVPRIVGVATGRRGIIAHQDGLSLADLLRAMQAGGLQHYPDTAGLWRDFTSAEQMIRTVDADVLVEASPTNLQSAQPALAHFYAALETGKHIVTANKGPIALAYPALRDLAREQGRFLRFEGSVMAGTPVIATGMELLAGCRILEARGIVNGTTNFILTRMESGMSYEAALQEAQQLGYAEADPTADVGGWDAAGKVLILMAALFGKTAGLHDLSVEGITGITAQDVEDAQAAGERYKLIASVTAEGGSVRPMRLPLTDPLAQVMNATNAITFRTDLMGNITVIGAGAGRKETGFALLSDLLAIHRIVNELS